MKKNKKLIIRGIICLIISIIVVSFVSIRENGKVVEISYSEARSKLIQQEIASVKLNKNTLVAKLYSEDSKITYKTKVPTADTFTEDINNVNVEDKIEYKIVGNTWVKDVILIIVFITVPVESVSAKLKYLLSGDIVISEATLVDKYVLKFSAPVISYIAITVL